MATIAENRHMWNEKWDWSARPHWCESSPITETFWQFCLAPRIAAFPRTGTVLEIACGFGRWTEFLLRDARQLIAVDLNEKCVNATRARFQGAPNLQVILNDGKSLDFVPDGSLDFVFSFDSLVHAGPDAMAGYCESLGRKLAPDGAAFLHHSNLKAVKAAISPGDTAAQETVSRGWRDANVSAEYLSSECARHGLACIVQEIINWNSPYPIDCLSTIVRRGSRYHRPPVSFVNTQFLDARNHLQEMMMGYVTS